VAEYSFDVGCKVDMQELNNALDLARKEVANRFDFKGAKAEIKLDKDALALTTSDEMRMKQLIDVIQTKLVKRELNLKAFQWGTFETNVSGVFKCKVAIQSGLTQEQTKKITKMIKDSKLKVQSRIQGDAVRVTGKSKDDLQEVQKMIRDADLEFAAVFDNYR
jgi:hypothetical protein